MGGEFRSDECGPTGVARGNRRTGMRSSLHASVPIRLPLNAQDGQTVSIILKTIWRLTGAWAERDPQAKIRIQLFVKQGLSSRYATGAIVPVCSAPRHHVDAPNTRTMLFKGIRPEYYLYSEREWRPAITQTVTGSTRHREARTALAKADRLQKFHVIAKSSHSGCTPGLGGVELPVLVARFNQFERIG